MITLPTELHPGGITLAPAPVETWEALAMDMGAGMSIMIVIGLELEVLGGTFVNLTQVLLILQHNQYDLMEPLWVMRWLHLFFMFLLYLQSPALQEHTSSFSSSSTPYVYGSSFACPHT